MNCYLVIEEDGLTVIDTAMAAGRVIVEGARHLGQPIRRILLTHAHGDHVGSVDLLKKLVPDAQLIVGKRESQLLAEAARGVKPGQMTLLGGEPHTRVKGFFKKVKTIPERVLEENDLVGSLRVMGTPGHTPGHLSFLDERDGSLYSGDALATFGAIRLPFDPPWYFPFPKQATWHFETALASVRRLATLNISRVLAGHGPAVEMPQQGLEQAIARAQKKIRS